MPVKGILSPHAEKQRLSALHPYQAMIQSGQQVYQEIAHLTAKIFLTPIVLLSLVEANDVIHAGAVGLPNLAASLPRAECICATAVYQPGISVFPDLQLFPCNWVKTELLAERGVRAYAGYPLKTVAGQPIGMLCLIDQTPRTFSPEDQLELQRIAAVAMRILDLQLALQHEPKQGPAVWKAINHRIALSIQRIGTLTALSQWETSSDTPAARSYRTSMHEERLLITQDIDREISIAFAHLGNGNTRKGLA
ncbi:GAF domain-containing protein [Hymenobacter sp. GOD-10R]|uniref:GAF domain-containing protein n=1 Tax=Hymenobacter sp. GOD-10R TaxID=3093922 RepID=UPI002D79121B|nr:GAF domain-containing protein [Hymenobacter sp. GOD-10R]WRQ29959.1 GAF domain-containing protein [Hymenobacter sp. GOD-10R]